MKKAGIVRFLGTNCDFDLWQAVEASGLEPEWLWYQDQFNFKDYSALFIPGGFSYGDYLRVGALAARGPVMKSVREAARAGVPILGICNGFQILCESGLLPGALLRNSHLRFVDRWVNLKLKSPVSAFAGSKCKGLRLPVAHGDGRYYVDEDGLKRLEDSEQVWLTYEENPNGSVANIAGIMNETKNVAALMPHPERAMFDWMGGDDGKNIFTTLL
jgi:phosphoribosylformylglycinamidine synthase